MLTTGRLTTTIFKSKYPLLPEKNQRRGPFSDYVLRWGEGGGGSVHMLKLKVFR